MMDPTREQILSSNAWRDMRAEVEAGLQRKFIATAPSDVSAIQDIAYQLHALRSVLRALEEGPPQARVNKRMEIV